MKTTKLFLLALIIFPLSGFSQPQKKQATNKNIKNLALTLPKQDLSSAEKDMLIKMREEEKLAHDVYVFLYEKWNMPIFLNISKSEANHTNQIKQMLDKYELEDPAKSQPGEFSDSELQNLYNSLTEKGAKTLKDALIVGATIEDLDIYDLENFLKQTDNDDIAILFNNLKRASGNHIRAFSRQLKRLYDYDYTVQYISQNEYDEIMSKEPPRRYNHAHNRPPIRK